MARAIDLTAEHIGERVVRLPLPLPLADLPLVNCYAILGDNSVTLVDPGWKSKATDDTLQAHLANLHAKPTDVQRILVTHAHWDHYTQALDWRERYGTTVLLGRAEGASIDRLDLSRGSFPQQVELLRHAGAPDLAETIDRLELADHERDMPFGPPDHWLDHGERIDCDGPRVTAIATPGHTRGHFAFQLDDLLFTGDHILPRITPSLAFEQAPERLPLGSYLSSLRGHLHRPDQRMLPAHGPVSPSVRARAGELLDHHDRRLAQTRDLVSSGASTAFAVARAMRWTRHQRTLDQLGSVHAMTAVLEVRAHLELLVDRGELTKGELTEHPDVVEIYTAA